MGLEEQALFTSSISIEPTSKVAWVPSICVHSLMNSALDSFGGCVVNSTEGMSHVFGATSKHVASVVWVGAHELNSRTHIPQCLLPSV